MLRNLLIALILSLPYSLQAVTPITGLPEVEPEHMYAYVLRHNPDFDRRIAEAFYNVGQRYGIRGDIALCQAIIETGWFRFDNGTAVQPESHNYCGLGVTRRGSPGCSFLSIEDGVTAMVQHLFAYCCTSPLPEGESVLDPRFNFVNRGCAPTWEHLSGRWAMNPTYGSEILRLFSDLRSLADTMTADRATIDIQETDYEDEVDEYDIFK